ncbi:MAG: DUF1003 domain-containing protein [Peptococcaceae bacterium]|nr:DUF1003 domain-containing protein [Peptococcaceae bacterium]
MGKKKHCEVPLPYDDEYTRRVSRLVDDYESHIMAHLNEQYLKRTSPGDRLSDKIAKFGGSWYFIVVFAVFLTLWMVWNSLRFTYHFDAEPFILLNLILSFTAAFQAPIILMSQNRQAQREKHETVIDFAINYKAELEIDDIQSHLHRIEGDLADLKDMLLANTPK